MTKEELNITPEMEKTLDTFLGSKVIGDVNRDRYLTCDLKDNRYKLTITVILDCTSHDNNEPDIFLAPYTGCVITFPAFWAIVPKETALNYMKAYIDQTFYGVYVKQWIIENGGHLPPIIVMNPDLPANLGAGCPVMTI